MKDNYYILQEKKKKMTINTKVMAYKMLIEEGEENIVSKYAKN